MFKCSFNSYLPASDLSPLPNCFWIHCAEKQSNVLKGNEHWNSVQTSVSTTKVLEPLKPGFCNSKILCCACMSFDPRLTKNLSKSPYHKHNFCLLFRFKMLRPKLEFFEHLNVCFLNCSDMCDTIQMQACILLCTSLGL